MLERVSMRSWTLASVAMGFLVALCIAIAPKPTCTRTANEVPALVEKTRDSTTRQRVIDDHLDGLSSTTCAPEVIAMVDELIATRALADTENVRARIDREIANYGPSAARALLSCNHYEHARRVVRIARTAGASDAELITLETRLGLRGVYR